MSYDVIIHDSVSLVTWIQEYNKQFHFLKHSNTFLRLFKMSLGKVIEIFRDVFVPLAVYLHSFCSMKEKTLIRTCLIFFVTFKNNSNKILKLFFIVKVTAER